MSGSSRETKPSSKFADCIVGDDLEDIFEDTFTDTNSDYEMPVVHHQIDGKINNVSFRTLPTKIDLWKNTVISFFGKENTTVLKDGTVLKVICDLENTRNNSIKINFYKTGAVVIQGAKCSQFNKIFFNKLKNKVDNKEQEYTEENKSSKSINTAQNKISENDLYNQQDHDIAETSLDSSITFAKTLVNSVHTSTPAHVKNASKNSALTPKERINQHSQSLFTKLENVNNSLLVIDSTLKSFINKLSEIKAATDNLIPTLKTSIPEMVVSNQKFVQVCEQVGSIDSKVKHCNQSVESIHVKLNILDTQLKQSILDQSEIQKKLEDNFKKIEQYHNDNNDSMDSVLSKICDLQNRLEKLEQAKNTSSSLNLTKSTDKSELRKSPETNQDRKDYDQETKSHDSFQEESKMECDYLILSDSILRRIIPGKFTPNGKTVKRFIRGGAQTCTSYVKKNGLKTEPKNILINIGTRDLQNTNGVKNEDFVDLCETLTKTWPNAKIFFLPIIRRKDISYDKVKHANSIIASECNKYSKISLIENFEPSDDMFHDLVHLNNRKGLPAVVRHLKNAMNMYPHKNEHNSNFNYHRNSTSHKGGYRNQKSMRHTDSAEQNISFDRPMMSCPPPPWIPPNNQFLPQWQTPWYWPPMGRFN